MLRLGAFLLAATMVAGFVTAPSAHADDGFLTSPRVPPDRAPGQVEQNIPALANSLNKPITGASQDPLVTGTERGRSGSALPRLMPWQSIPGPTSR